MKRSIRNFLRYCPHPPLRREHEFDAGPYWVGSRLSIQVRDFQSTLDGIVAYAILFSLLFLSSFVGLPTTGLVEIYRDSLLRTGLVAALAFGVILVYAKLTAKNALQFRLVNAKESLLASLFVLLIWGAVWILFGELSKTYRLALEPSRLGLAPLALCVGLLDGLIVYGYCTERFVTGVGRTSGIFISSVFGWLLFLAVSVDFALYLLPTVLVLAYVGVRSESPLGPTVATGLLMAFFYVYFAASPWMLGSRQTGYWLMTAVSVASAFVAGLILVRVPVGGASYGRSSAI